MSNLTNLRLPIGRSTMIILLILLSHSFIRSAHAQEGDDIRINYIEVPETAFVGDELLIRWDVSGVESIPLFYGASTDFYSDHKWDTVPNVGEMRIKAAGMSHRGGHGSFNMFFSFNIGGEDVDKITRVLCRYEAFFLKPDEETWCSSKPIVSQASMQQFENGFMLWVEERDEIVVLSANIEGSVYWIGEDDFEHGRDPISDETIVPPPGKYQPEYGFGKVWREVEWVRDTLGWAISAPTDYETVVQSFDQSSSTPEGGGDSTSSTFWRLPDGSVLKEYESYDFGTGNSYHSLTIRTELDGYAHPNNGFRTPQTENPSDGDEITSPPVNSAVPCPVSGAWPAGCDPNLPPSTDTPTPPTNGTVSCPVSGVWPAGCNPNLSPPTSTPTSPVNGMPCPTSGVWPAGCVPNSGGTPTPRPSGNDCVIPERGPWPPCATAGNPPPANTPNDCIIPPSGPWPACARG